MILEEMIEAARGARAVDLLLRNCKLVNVLSGEVYSASIAIWQGRVVGFGDDYKAKEEMDLKGMYAAPGFFDSHVHLESTMLTAPEFARAVLPLGTTSVVFDPHEIANVLGLEGIRYILETTENLPLNVFIVLPSCVPATDLETSGAHLLARDLEVFKDEERVLGLAEMMNYPGVIYNSHEVIDKLKAFFGKVIDGHAPGLNGKELMAYAVTGIGSDHECTTEREAEEKLRLGMHIMIREGTTAKNMDELINLVFKHPNYRISFCTDDKHPDDIEETGHINYIVRRAIQKGVPPIVAYQMATINAANYFKLSWKFGAIAPGRRADIIVLDDLNNVSIRKVFVKGRLVVHEGELVKGVIQPVSVPIRGTINVAWLYKEDFAIRARGKRANVINIVPDQVVTRKSVEAVKIEDGFAVADTERDILKIAVIERHLASGRIGLGFVRGFGFKSGAVASSVAHDSHNIIVVGTNDDDMLTAAVKIVKMQGGQVVVKNGEIIEALPLPIGGLISDQPYEEVKAKCRRIREAAQSIGSALSDPLMVMSFLALAVIPELRLTDKGLVDVTQFKIIPLFVKE